jgi:ABC-type antimicrobial peptide transport system permease subunit
VFGGLREAADSVDPAVALASVKTMEERMAVPLWPFNTMRRVFSMCGVLALALATVGLASVVSHAVSRRRREFGVRLSIGAAPRQVTGLVLRDSLRLFAPGLLAGLILAMAAARLAQAVFVGVNVLNPATYALVALLEGAVIVAACLGPAVRAARVDPLVALRSE